MKKLHPFKFLLSIVDPQYHTDVQPEEVINNKILLESTIKLAKKNGLYYYFVYKLKQLNMRLPILEKKWDSEDGRLLMFKNTLKLLGDISTYGIDYILIKRYGTLPHIPRDVDIFIRADQKEKIIKLLQLRGMQYVVSLASETSLNAIEFIPIDLYTEITYISVNFIDSSYLWNSKIKVKIFENEHWSLSPEADFLLTVVHNFISHRRLTLLDFLHLKSLKAQITLEACKRYAYSKGWGQFFVLALNKLNFLEENIYKNGGVVHFPYLFDRKFILKCISSIDGLNLSDTQKLFLNVSLVQDEFLHKIKSSSFYELIRSCYFVRKATNFLGCFVRRMRGDTKAR